MKNFILGSIAAVVTFAIGLFVYLGLGFAPVGADAKPPAWEAALMNSVVHASVRRSAAKIQDQATPSDQTLIAGGKLYLNDCVGCHGEPGKGASTFGATFYPQAPQFPMIGTRYSEAEVFWVARHGIRRTGMTSQAFYSDTELRALSAFIKGMGNLSPTVVKGIQQPSSR